MPIYKVFLTNLYKPATVFSCIALARGNDKRYWASAHDLKLLEPFCEMALD